MNQILNFLLLGFIGPQEIIIIMILILPGLGLIPLVLYLVTLQNTLSAISYENRKMQPGQVWLSLIPVFGLVWQFIIVDRVADSLRKEFIARNWSLNEERPGIGIGMAYCILFSCSIILFVTVIPGLVCWIIYWLKINDYRLKLNQIYYTQQWQSRKMGCVQAIVTMLSQPILIKYCNPFSCKESNLKPKNHVKNNCFHSIGNF